MSEVEENRELLAEAREIEQRRIEVCLLAIERNVADLLPQAWNCIMEFEDQSVRFVEVKFPTSLCPGDEEAMSERDCRNFVAFVAALADDLRVQSEYSE
jgi:hypothetical protein